MSDFQRGAQHALDCHAAECYDWKTHFAPPGTDPESNEPMKTKNYTATSILTLILGCAQAPSDDAHLATRRFEFEYTTTVTEIPQDAKKARLWLPLPVDDEAQSVKIMRVTAPVPHRVGRETAYGNETLYLEVDAPLPAELQVTMTLEVERKEVRSVSRLAGAPRRDLLLRGDRLAPLNEEAKSRALLATTARVGSTDEARGIYDRVLSDVNYDKTGEGWGRGSLDYVCENGKGNCSDFHSLFIAMARSKQIPAVFEIGFPLPKDKEEGAIGGYHCWAWFQDEKGRWRPVDASEADKDPTRAEYFFGTICENRVAFSRGRDLVLDPPQDGSPVNFLIYPHVEVDGKTDVAKVEKSFRFKNL